MKRQILFLSIITFFALSALAQTPYDNFAPEQSVKSMIEMPETKFKVVNSDSNSKIHSIEFDKNSYLWDEENPISSRYVMCGHDTRVAARLLAENWQQVVSTEDLVIYKRP